MYKILGSVVMDLGNFNYFDLKAFVTTSFWNYHYVKFSIMLFILLIFIYPLSLYTDISKLSFSSFLGVLSLLFVIVLVAAQSPWYIHYYWTKVYNEKIASTHLNLFNVKTGFMYPTYNFFTGMATIFYAYCCHFGVFAILKTLNHRTPKRAQAIIKTTILFDLSLYLLVGMLGYLSAPIKTPTLIIGRFKLFSSDIIFSFAKLFFVLTVLVKIPAAYNSFRLSFIELFLQTNEVSKKVYITLIKFLEII